MPSNGVAAESPNVTVPTPAGNGVVAESPDEVTAPTLAGHGTTAEIPNITAPTPAGKLFFFRWFLAQIHISIGFCFN